MTNHDLYQFGILYPSHKHGVGSPADLLAFLRAVRLYTKGSGSDFETVLKLGEEPVWGPDMILLFAEAQKLEAAFSKIQTTEKTFDELRLTKAKTKLNLEAETLRGLFSRIFKALAHDAPELVEYRMRKPDDPIMESGSIRFGPIEPIHQSTQFARLKKEAFKTTQGPLWLSDEIFDEAFYERSL